MPIEKEFSQQHNIEWSQTLGWTNVAYYLDSEVLEQGLKIWISVWECNGTRIGQSSRKAIIVTERGRCITRSHSKVNRICLVYRKWT